MCDSWGGGGSGGGDVGLSKRKLFSIESFIEPITFVEFP